MWRWTVAAGLITSSLLVHAAGGDTRGDFLRLIDRPRVDLAAVAVDDSKPTSEPTTAPTTVPRTDLRSWHFSFATAIDQRVPGILIGPPAPNDRLPVVIVLHGTGGTKESELPLL